MMNQLAEQVDHLFDSLLTGRSISRQARQSWMPGQSMMQDMWIPEVEVREQGNQLRIHVDVPGVPRDKVNVDIQDGTLTIRGERSEERSDGDEEQGYRRSERRYGSFFRSIELPEGVDTENAQAMMKDGVLDITLPYSASKQKRRLEIKGDDAGR